MIRSVLWLLMLWLPATITTYQDWLVVNSPYKGPVTRKMFPFDDVIMFRRRSQKTSKFRVTGLCAGNSPVPGASALELLFLALTHRYMIGTWRDNAKSEHAAEDQFEIRSRRISCHLHLSRRFQFRPDQCDTAGACPDYREWPKLDVMSNLRADINDYIFNSTYFKSSLLLCHRISKSKGYIYISSSL